MSKLPMSEAEYTQQLKKDIQTQSLSISSPPQLDHRIEQLYDDYAQSLNKSNNLFSKNTTPKFNTNKNKNKKFNFFKRHKWLSAIATILCILVLSSGVYASNMVYSITTGHTLLSYTTDTKYDVTLEEGKEIMSIINQVRAKLAPGEAAYVYSTKVTPLEYGPVIKVKQPHRYDTLTEWEKTIGAVIHQVAVPHELPQGYTFSYGTDDYTYEGAYENDKHRQIKMIKGLLANKVENPTADYAWMIDDRPIVKRYKTPMLYYNHQQANSNYEIRLNYSIVATNTTGNNKIDIVDPSDTSQSTISSSKGNMIYSKIQRTPTIGENKEFEEFSQYLTWSEYNEKTHQSIMYTLSSNTPQITKEELVQMAESIK